MRHGAVPRLLAAGLLLAVPAWAGAAGAQPADEAAPSTGPAAAPDAPPESAPQDGPAGNGAGENGTLPAGEAAPPTDDLDLRNLRNVFGLPDKEAGPAAPDVPRLPAPDIPFRVAVLRGLDKITARVSTFDAPIGEAVGFGTLSVTARACRERPQTETPESAAYLEIQETKPDEGTVPVFHGWMFASSPSLSALEHPVYDVWVIACKTAIPAGPADATAAPLDGLPAPDAPAPAPAAPSPTPSKP